jgi:hypothetical protein
MLQANQNGNQDYNAANMVTQVFSVGLAPQTIVLTNPNVATRVVGGSTYTPAATASSGLPVSFLIDASSAGACSISGGVVSFIGVGSCAVIARQSGNNVYNAASDVVQQITVGKGSQTLSLGANPVSPVVAGPSFTFNATSTAGLPVALSSATAGVCTVSNLVVRKKLRKESFFSKKAGFFCWSRILHYSWWPSWDHGI